MSTVIVLNSQTDRTMSYTEDMDNELNIAVQIAREAGEIMRTHFDSDQQRMIKSDGTPLTIADTTINRLVIERLAEHFPDDIVIGEEESTGEYGMGRRWFCDPIDGTKAFTWGVPTAMFSLGLVVDGRPMVGICYEPMLDRMYTAVRGEGAYRNGEKLQVNSLTLEQGIFGSISSHYRIRHEAPYLEELLQRRIDMAAFSGAVGKCVRVAEGRFTGYVEELVNAHDMAASEVIVTEAGGRVSSMTGQPLDYSRPFRGALVSNGVVHDELLAIIARAT